ncbi:MAG: ATP-binding protein [Chloroflexota bacterium]|nr:ATP-binding protein [Chloroflexota bacterium]
MNSDERMIVIPRSLTSIESIETLYHLVQTQPAASAYAFDMTHVPFIKPYGVVGLVAAARLLTARSGRPVQVLSLDAQVHQYLHRMDVFEGANEWLSPPPFSGAEWSRTVTTANLLELHRIGGPSDIAPIITRAERIFTCWLDGPHLHGLLNVLSEVCANIYQHSGDSAGCVVIQKYEMGQDTVICLAVGDLGWGIRNTLEKRYGILGTSALPYLHDALHGRSSRATGRGGLGLRLVKQIARDMNGMFWLRSEGAALLAQQTLPVVERADLAHVPGTQIVVELRAPLRS